MDNDYRRLLAHLFMTWVRDNGRLVRNVGLVYHSPTDPNTGPQLAGLHHPAPDVFIAMTGGTACLETVAAPVFDQLDPAAKILPSTCVEPAAHLEPAGAAADG